MNLKSKAAVDKKISETYQESQVEFELAKEARKMADQEMKEIKLMAAEIHAILKEIQNKKDPAN